MTFKLIATLTVVYLGIKLAKLWALFSEKSEVPDSLVGCCAAVTEEDLVIVLVGDVALLGKHLTPVSCTMALSNLIARR